MTDHNRQTPVLVAVGELTVPSRVDLDPAAKATRDALVVAAKQIETVDDPLAAEIAGETLRGLKAWLNGVEDARKVFKRPALEAGKRVDKLATDLSALIAQHAKRIAGLLGTWQAEQRRRAREEEEALRKKEAEERQRALEAERKARQETETTTEEEIARKEIRQESKANLQQIKRDIVDARATGRGSVGVRTTYSIKVTDPESLWKARPDLVDLVPRQGDILAEVRKGIELPGVEVTKGHAAVV